MTRTLTLVHDAQTTDRPQVLDLGSYRSDRYRDLLEQARRLMLDGHEALALERCHDAVRVRRDGYEALALAGSLLAMMDDLERAAEYTQAAIRVAPDRPDAYYDLASTLLDLERPEEALYWADQGLSRLGRREDDLVDFLLAAKVEALTELRRYEDAEATLAAARDRTSDPLQLLAGAREFLDDRRRKPVLRVV